MKIVKKISLCILLSVGAQAVAQQSLAAYPIRPVPINKVKVTDNFWLPIIKQVQ